MDTYLDERALSQRLSLSPRTIQRLRISGEGPPFVRLGRRRVAYRESDVRAWSESRTYPHRAAELAASVRK
jgi:predicted DNA-binding transcriptional regulator AlpA